MVEILKKDKIIMTEQEKMILLLQDICERIPNGVKCKTKSKDWQGGW